jgi:hypothetical protein
MRDQIVDTSVRCRFCGASFYWALTVNGKFMPIEPAAEPGPAGNLVLQDTLLETRVVVVVGPGDGTHRHHKTTCHGWQEHNEDDT